MTLDDQLKQVIKRLQCMDRKPSTIYNEYNQLWQSLGFTKTQLSLWLASLPLKNRQKEPSAGYQVTPDIAAYLVSLLRQADGRMPLAQVLKKLPAGITTSEQQIRKLAQQHAHLDIKGPLLILVS